MFAELEKIMNFSIEHKNFLESLNDNIIGKKSADGIKQSGAFLKKLYNFDPEYKPFIAFTYFWKIAETRNKSLLTFIYAVNHDDLLSESIQVVRKVIIGEKAKIEYFEEIIEKYHPNTYTPKTRLSMAQNIASSWKQAGFIEGRVKNIRVQPEINVYPVCFAFLLAYLKGDRGDYLWNSIGVQALCLYESQLRALAVECAKRDLMQYQYAGGVTLINFDNLLNQIGIDGF